MISTVATSSRLNSKIASPDSPKTRATNDRLILQDEDRLRRRFSARCRFRIASGATEDTAKGALWVADFRFSICSSCPSREIESDSRAGGAQFIRKTRSTMVRDSCQCVQAALCFGMLVPGDVSVST